MDDRTKPEAVQVGSAPERQTKRRRSRARTRAKCYPAGSYDVAVVGAGHAGVEAALAAARLGMKTVLFTISLDAIANMPCNPSIGGTAKGHLVREIDALGGEMGKAADETFLQSRMLNRGKGPAVHSLRVQADRMQYHIRMKRVLEQQPGLTVKQAEIVAVRARKLPGGKKRAGQAGGGEWEAGNGKSHDSAGGEVTREVTAVVTSLGAVYQVKAAILCTGTYLDGRIFVGEVSYSSGPDGCQAAIGLSASLEKLGIRLRRFKTGTPARALRSSIDFSQLEVQEGDEEIVPFSFETTGKLENRAVCHIAYTNEDTHRVILDNLHRSPLYSGKIEGVGPRYCPSIEDKVVRFSDKPRHQIFVEPMGLDTEEMYLQGMSSSLPEEVQLQFYRTIKGFEKIEIMRNAYAIEYDCCDPLDLRPTLEFKRIRGLYGAGQFNGTSGYEEAAAQGLVAGINAARKINGDSPLLLERSGSYIGTLIDDLVTKGCNDPYRMMTSRSEYRLLLRQDNADLRLTPTGYEVGLISEERWNRYLEKQFAREQEQRRLENTSVAPSPELNALLEERGTSPISTGCRLADLLRRPQLRYEDLAPFDPSRPSLDRAVAEEVEISIKYSGYIQKQLAQVEQMHRMEQRSIPEDLRYSDVSGLRLEAQEKLERVRPVSVGQASRISGVNPADIAVLLIYLQQTRQLHQADPEEGSGEENGIEAGKGQRKGGREASAGGQGTGEPVPVQLSLEELALQEGAADGGSGMGKSPVPDVPGVPSVSGVQEVPDMPGGPNGPDAPARETETQRTQRMLRMGERSPELSQVTETPGAARASAEAAGVEVGEIEIERESGGGTGHD